MARQQHDMTPVLQTRALTKQYGAKIAVRDLDLSIEQGSIFGLLGPNGSGKSTTLGMVLGIIKPSAGQYAWFGRPPKDSDRTQIGALLEQPNFFPSLSARQNLRITATVRRISDSDIGPALSRVGLERVANRAVRTFSLGMRQRLAIASATLGQPRVLILDEPTNGLDPEGIAEMRAVMLEEARAGRTVIMASHILAEVEKVCSHVAILRQGEIILNGAVNDVLAVEDRVEVAAADLNRLAASLRAHAGVQSLERQGDGFVVTLQGGLNVANLNRYLVENGVYPSHLVQRKQTLESQFLEVLKQ
jgi:ABC-2 type transport system ATP-binding protein